MNYGRLNYELWPPIYGECRVWIGSNDHPAGGCTYQGVCVQRDRTTPCICTILIGYNQGQPDPTIRMGVPTPFSIPSI